MPRRILGFLSPFLEYKPSWFAESGSGVGILLWAIFACFTTDYNVYGWAWVLPGLGFIFGPLRFALLLRLNAVLRVSGAVLGALWWGWLSISLYSKMGIVPSLAGYLALLYGDGLTLLRFSFRAWQSRVESYPLSAH